MLISIHPPHAGRDCVPGRLIWSHLHFNPPSPCGEGLLGSAPVAGVDDFNPPSPCGEGLVPSDLVSLTTSDFNPPSPCGEGPVNSTGISPDFKFQSTLPMRGGTQAPGRFCWPRRFQSTLPMRGGTLAGVKKSLQLQISIHPPHAGRDSVRQRLGPPYEAFQSTLPMRGGTYTPQA